MIDGLAHPSALWTLLALLPIGWLRLRQKRRQRVIHAPLQYASLENVPGPSRRRRLARLSLPLELLVLAVALVALAGPYREQRLELFEDEGIDVMLVLDISLSMLAEDFPPNRLDALRRIARDFVARSGGHRLGIVVFAGDAYVQSPLTTDLGFVTSLLEEATVHAISQSKSGGTAVGDALLVATDRLLARRVEGRDQAVILITDGESNLGIDPVLAARHLADSEIRLYAIGIGGREPIGVTFEGRVVGQDGHAYQAYLDDGQLEAIAEAAGGRYDRADAVGVLEELFVELSRLESAPLEPRTLARRHSLSPILALVLLPLFALRLFAVEGLLRRPFR